MKEKKFLRKDQLLEAALYEFTTNAYEKASLNKIIKSSGISKGVFYYHFKNKEDLYLYLLKVSADKKWQYINEQALNNEVNFNKMNIFDKFIYQAKIGAGFAAIYPKYHTLSRMLLKEKNNPIYRTAIDYLGSNSTDIIAAMIKDAITRREIKPEFDETFVVKVLSHLFLEFDQIFDQEYEKDKVLSNLKYYVKFIKYGFKA